MEAISLYELNQLVRRSLSECFPDQIWVRAELSDVRVHAGGHCYVEFIEKDSRGNNLIAKARGTIWSNIFRLLKAYFEEETGQLFTSGIKVLVCVSVEFHELYGYSLTVKDIDPSYTLGDMARKRREILKQLEAEGVLTLNKELSMPLFPQRIAVISSVTAAGYGDFCNQLSHNPYGFVFYPKLFQAVMQGERVEESIIGALNRINEQYSLWDVVVIIRGGGATSDLSGFDTYLLAANCAQFPLPILTGIGHERDDTVIDSVAHTRVKTPTAAAEFLISRTLMTATNLEALRESIETKVSACLRNEKQRVEWFSEKLPTLFSLRKLREGHRISMWKQRVCQACRTRLSEEHHKLQLLSKEVDHASPENLLKRGYSITLKDRKAVTDFSLLRDGDELETILAKGSVRSKVIKKIKNYGGKKGNLRTGNGQIGADCVTDRK